MTATGVSATRELVRPLNQEILALASRVLAVTSEILPLVAKYPGGEVLVVKCQADVLHIAVSTIAGFHALASRNFKHIVQVEETRLP